MKLDANETGEIVVTITNTGQGEAYGVEVNAKLENEKSVTVSPSADIGDIPSGQSRTTKLNLYASSDVGDGKMTALITYNESNGFAPAGNKITFETESVATPKLILADLGIDDFNKNGKIEPGEIVNVTVRIQNAEARHKM